MKRDLLKDLANYVPSQVVPALVGFASIPLLTNLFPPDVYGDYRLVLATVVLFGTATSWIPSSTIRFYPEQDVAGSLGVFYANLIRFWLLSTVVFSLIWILGLIGARSLLGDRLYLLYWIGLAVLIINSVFGVLTALIRSRREVRVFSFITMWRSLMGLGFGVFLILVMGLGTEGFLWGMAISGGVVVPMLWRRASSDISVDFGPGFDSHLASGMARYALPLTLGSVAGWVLRLSDRFLIELYAGSSDLGIYSAAYGLAEQSIGIIVQLFHLPFVILGNRVWERDGPEAAGVLVAQATRFFMMVAVPAVVGISVLSKPMVTVMTGPDYLLGYRIIPWVAAGMLAFGLSQWYLAAFMFTKKMAFHTVGIVVGGLANVALNLILLPRYGYEVAAVTSLVGFGVVLLVIIPRSRQLFDWGFPWRSLGRIGVASAVMGLLLAVFRNLTELSATTYLLLGVPLGIAVVALVLVILGEFSARELALLRTIRGRRWR